MSKKGVVDARFLIVCELEPGNPPTFTCLLVTGEEILGAPRTTGVCVPDPLRGPWVEGAVHGNDSSA